MQSEFFGRLCTIREDVGVTVPPFMCWYMQSEFFGRLCTIREDVGVTVPPLMCWYIHAEWVFWKAMYYQGRCRGNCAAIDVLIYTCRVSVFGRLCTIREDVGVTVPSLMCWYIHAEWVFWKAMYYQGRCRGNWAVTDVLIHAEWVFWKAMYYQGRCRGNCAAIDVLIHAEWVFWKAMY